MDMFVSSTAFAAAPAAMPASPDASAALIAAAASLLDHLERGRAIDAPALRAAMESTPSAAPTPKAPGTGRPAYDACEAAQVLFLRKFGPACARARARPRRCSPCSPSSRRCCPRTPAAPKRARRFSNSRRRSRSASSPPPPPRSRPPISCWSPRPAPACSPSSPSSPARARPQRARRDPRRPARPAVSGRSGHAASTRRISTIISTSPCGRASC